MFKSKAYATLTLILAAVAVLSTATIARNAYAAGDDVFMDEGNGDFDSMPAPPPQAEEKAPIASAPVATKAPEPREALPTDSSQDQIPQLTDEAAQPSTPETAPAPAPTPTKVKKAKKAAKTADASPAPVAAKGQFVTTKDACPMMRSPASTGETMITVKAARKIWVEDAGEGYYKAWNKAGEPGYVSKDCVQ